MKKLKVKEKMKVDRDFARQVKGTVVSEGWHLTEIENLSLEAFSERLLRTAEKTLKELERLSVI